jgi:hypothetical protein
MSSSGISHAGEQIWQAVQAINRACREGYGFAELAPQFFDLAALVATGGGQHAQGRDACLKNLEDFTRKSNSIRSRNQTRRSTSSDPCRAAR